MYFVVRGLPRPHSRSGLAMTKLSMLKKIPLLILIILIAWSAWSWFGIKSGVGTFAITKGQGMTEVATVLKDKKILTSSKVFFYLQVLLSGKRSAIIAGDYKVDVPLTISQLVTKITGGEVQDRERSITIVEGWTKEEIGTYLEKEGIITSADFLSACKNKKWWTEYSFLSDAKSLEGYLFPDTYRIFKDATADDIIKKMLDNFGNKFNDDFKREIASRGRSINDIVIMASILEKEVTSDNDRALVADVFYKRLQKGIALQSDATIAYALGEKTTQISLNDLKVNSPYNTYKYKGLPAGAIDNPGFSTIQSAVYPKSNPYYYFLTTSDGQVIYAKTFDEHVANKQKYLK